MAANRSFRVHPLAWREIDAADDWYFEHSPEASDMFVAEVTQALVKISQTPQLWPTYLHGTRRFILKRFPFSVVYLDGPEISVIAVAHHKRRPGYWKQRV